MTSTPTNGVRTSRPSPEANATRVRMAEAIVDAMLARGRCDDDDLERQMFTPDEIRLHKIDAMTIARADDRVRSQLTVAA